MTLREIVIDAQKTQIAIGHFNISDSNQLEAIAEAAKELQMPVVVGLSEGERDYFPLSHARALINEYVKEGVQLFLNADHTRSIEKAQEAIASGVDAIVADGSLQPFAENVHYAKEVVRMARESGRDILVEGELGYIGSASQMYDELPEGVAVSESMMTKADEISTFVTQTNVDMMAPAVGNVHGIIKGGDPKLSINRIKELHAAVSVPLVLHGASGNTDEEIREAIRAGMAIVHINTEFRVVYRKGLEDVLHEEPEELAPYKYLKPTVADMKEFIKEQIKLFGMMQ